MLKAALISAAITLFFALLWASIGMDPRQISVLCLIIYYGNLLGLKDVIE